MKLRSAVVGCAWFGALILAAQLVVVLVQPSEAATMHPQPMSLPTGIDIVQTVRAHDGTFLLSCTNGRILWVQRVDTHSWTNGWIESEREDVAEGNYWTLLTADREVWAYDSRKLIRVWE